VTKDDRRGLVSVGIERVEVDVLTAVLVAIAGCSDEPPELVVEQPHVRVEQLGAVQPPAVHTVDGAQPEGLSAIAWTVSDSSVARVEEGVLVAVDAGEAEVVGHWRGQEVRWHLEVDPTTTLHFVEPPHEIGVGESVQLTVVAEHGGTRSTADRVRGLSFESSADEVLKVSADGQIIGVSTGVGYVTARAKKSRSVLEIRVVTR
jgi:hypothetical protein